MRNVIKGEIFELKDQVPIKKNQTITKKLNSNGDYTIYLFSMYSSMDISAERYSEDKFYYIFGGEIAIGDKRLRRGEFLVAPAMELFAIQSYRESVFLEISVKIKEGEMNNLDKGKVIELKNLIDYVDGGVANLDIVSNANIKMMIMAFDAGEGLTPHSAPSDALVIPLEGEAELLVGEETFRIKVGEQMVFPKDITHNVTAITKYKMLLILSMD